MVLAGTKIYKVIVPTSKRSNFLLNKQNKIKLYKRQHEKNGMTEATRRKCSMNPN